MTQLNLTILEPKDIEVLSTHLQDGIIRFGDMSYMRASKRFAFIINRFDWELAENSKNKKLRRHLSGVHFEGVSHVRTKAIKNGQDDVILELLSIEFVPGDKPSGTISLKFAAGAEIVLDVDYVEALLKDLGPSWQSRSRPDHGLEDEGE